MAKSLLSAIAAMALAAFASTEAEAVTPLTSYNFDFSSGYIASSTGGTSIGNSITFKSTTDPQLQVKVTAWSIDKKEAGLTNTTDDVVTAAALKLWSGGLGVQNKYEDGTAPNHSIDNGIDPTTVNGVTTNHYMVDFVLLQFNWDTDINTMTTGWVSGDQDATLRVGAGPTGNPATWSTTPALDGKKVFGANAAVELADYVNVADTSLNSTTTYGSPYTRSVNSSSQHGMVWLLGALYGSQSNDFFKLDLLNVTVYPTIPEPSTWMTMILGFGFVGGIMRRRKAPLGASPASLA